MLLSVGLPLIFLPILAASYYGIPPDKPTKPPPSSMPRATPAVRSASQSSPTCCPIANNPTRAAWSIS